MPFLCFSKPKFLISKNAPSVSFSPHHSIPKTPNQATKSTLCIIDKPTKQDSVPKDEFTAVEMRRRSVLLVAPLLFLPVRGCTTGGFYDTGITENCQKLYQPAAAAEERLKQKLAGEMKKGILNDQQTRLERFEKGDELLAKQDENREVLDAEKLERTRKKVEEMWQSLE